MNLPYGCEILDITMHQKIMLNVLWVATTVFGKSGQDLGSW
jgi:hypothetical protein